MHWLFLFLAILFEVAGTTCMKLSSGSSRPVPTFFMVVFYLLCFGVFSLALKKIEVSVAYPIWSGLGTVLIAGIGIYFFNETFSLPKLIFVAMIVLGVAGLKVSG